MSERPARRISKTQPHPPTASAINHSDITGVGPCTLENPFARWVKVHV